MNLKEGDRCVIDHGEGLTAVDFGNDVILAEKLVQHGIGAAELLEQKLSLDSESEKRRSSGCSRRSKYCSVSIALWKKTLATSKGHERVREEVAMVVVAVATQLCGHDNKGGTRAEEEG
ncbi:hypothetical protein BHE74_00020991 [Ensete ventricosum]|nr:hypothetical protein BHE74_00020991 [Ensete ventricosum]